jgi:hypothetical protein
MNLVLDKNRVEQIEKQAKTAKIQQIANYLQKNLGQKITAYLSGLKDPKVVGLWSSGCDAPMKQPSCWLMPMVRKRPSLGFLALTLGWTMKLPLTCCVTSRHRKIFDSLFPPLGLLSALPSSLL